MPRRFSLSEVQCIVGLLLGMPVPWPWADPLEREDGSGQAWTLWSQALECSETQLAASVAQGGGHWQNRPGP